MTRQNPDDATLPIDIDYAKFLSWLIDRRRVPRTWHSQLKSARTLARAAYSATPQSLLSNFHLPLTLGPHENLTYASVRRVLQSCSDSNFDFDPSAWKKASTAFQRDNVFLADAAQQLVRHTNVDMPALRDRASRLTADTADASRRHGIAVRSAEEADNRFREAYAKYRDGENEENCEGEGEDVEDLRTLVERFVTAHAPRVLRRAALAARDVVDALDYYDAFAEFVAKPGTTEGVKRCGTLRAVTQADIDSLIRTRRTPGVAQKEKKADGATDTIGVINWEIEIEDVGSGENADMGGTTNAEAGGIDWDIGDAITIEQGQKQDGNESVSKEMMDCGIEVSFDTKSTENLNGEVDARDDVSLANMDTREAVLDDVVELEAFLLQRVTELGREGGSGGGQGIELIVVAEVQRSMPEGVARGERDVRAMLKRVGRLRDALAGAEAREVMRMGASKRGLERAVRELIQKRAVRERARNSMGSLQTRGQNVAMELRDVQRQMEDIKEVTRDVVRHCEETLSGMYKGREVHMFGEVRKLIAGA